MSPSPTTEATTPTVDQERDGAAQRHVVRRLVTEAGRTTQMLGFGRVVGQIYAHLYFSESAATLADLQDDLGISKGSASTGVRRLETWGAVRRIWRKGDRKDYYAAELGFGCIIRKAVMDAYALKMQAVDTLLEDVADDIDDDHEFLQERLQHLREFRERARKAYENPIVQHLLH